MVEATPDVRLRAHPLADLLPLIHGAEFDALVADIRQHGCPPDKRAEAVVTVIEQAEARRRHPWFARRRPPRGQVRLCPRRRDRGHRRRTRLR